jgi:uncharacterized membrane protein
VPSPFLGESVKNRLVQSGQGLDMKRLRQIGVAIVIVALAGCGTTEKSATDIDDLERCARAIVLEAEAYERHDRVKRLGEVSPALSVAWQAVVATDRYRANACFAFPPDAFSPAD